MRSFIIMLALAGTAFAQESLIARPGGLTADQAAAQAVSTSFDVQAQRDNVRAAQAGVDQAVASYLPKLTLGARYLRQIDIPPVAFGPPPAPTIAVAFPDNWDFEANLSIPVSDYLLRLAQAKSSANHSRQAAVLTEKATVLETAANARIAYYSWVRARLQVPIADQALANAKSHQTDVKHAFDAGSSTRADVLRVDSQVAQSELLVTRARNAERLAAEALRTAMHATSGALEIGEDINAELEDLSGAADLDALYQEAIAHRPEIGALFENRAALLDEARAVRAGYWPRLDAIANFTEGDPNVHYFPVSQDWKDYWSVGLQLTWNVTDIAATRAQARGVDARAAQVVAQRGAVVDGLTTEVRQAYLAIDEAKAARDSTDRALGSALEALRVRQELFRNGHATSTELTDAETDLTRAQFDSLNARIDLRIGRVRLVHATGRDIN